MRALAATVCKKQQTGVCGVPRERIMSSSGLQRDDDKKGEGREMLHYKKYGDL